MRARKKSAPSDPIWPRLARLALLATFGPVRSFLASFCPVWPNLALFGPFDPFGQVLPHKALFGLVLPSLTPFGPIWLCLASCGTIWPRLAPFSPAWPLVNFDFKVPIRQGVLFRISNLKNKTFFPWHKSQRWSQLPFRSSTGNDNSRFLFFSPFFFSCHNLFS